MWGGNSRLRRGFKADIFRSLCHIPECALQLGRGREKGCPVPRACHPWRGSGPSGAGRGNSICLNELLKCKVHTPSTQGRKSGVGRGEPGWGWWTPRPTCWTCHSTFTSRKKGPTQCDQIKEMSKAAAVRGGGGETQNTFPLSI